MPKEVPSMMWIWIVVIGGIAGWLAGMVMTGRGFGLVGNIVVGIVGAVIGKWVFGAMGMSLSYFWASLLGAIILLVIAGLFKRSGSTPPPTV